MVSEVIVNGYVGHCHLNQLVSSRYCEAKRSLHFRCMHSNESRRLGGSASLCVRSDELLKPNNQDQNLGQACIHTLLTILHNFPNPKNKKLARVTYLSAIHIVKGKAILKVIVKQKRVREV